MYQLKLSLREVAKYMLDFHNVKVTWRTIKSWVEKQGFVIKKFVSKFKYNFSGLWHFDEIFFKWKIRDPKNKHKVIEDKCYYCWNAMDAESRFMIPPEYSESRTDEYAKNIANRFIALAKNAPQQVVSDSASAYKIAFPSTLYRINPLLLHTKFVMIKGEHGNNLIERANQTIRDRARPFKGFRPINNSPKILDMFYLHCDFIRPHSSLNGKTPAEVAGVDLKLQHNYKGLLKLMTLSLNYVHKIFLKEKQDTFSASSP